MMFPFALTLYSAALNETLRSRGSDLADLIKKRYGYELGYNTVLNVLRLGEESDTSRRVADAGRTLRRTASGMAWRPAPSFATSASSAC